MRVRVFEDGRGRSQMKRSALAGIVGLTLLATGTLHAADTYRYLHLDAIGNVRVVTDENQAVIERHDYLPFGEECTTGLCASNPGVVGGQPKRFTGKERDPETGLDYFGARYYGSKIGRFTTVDPYLDTSAALLNPQRWNRYAYGLNNPLRNVDPDGRDAWDIVTGLQQRLHNWAVRGRPRFHPGRIRLG
jgi:RHS repeat-associated protein